MNIKSLSTGVLLLGTAATGATFAADRAIDPYQDREDKYVLEVISDIPQGERVEIHKDKAQLDLKFWNDEETISIIPQIPSASFGAADRPFNAEAKRPFLSKRMEYKSGDVTAFIEPKEGTDNEFDIDFTLESKPDTNVFTYKIEGAEEFDFLYQPELTPEEIAEGAERSENVVGSYAVYHKTKANHRVGSTNYVTGKVFHIYRPKAIDANGNQMWANLQYNNELLTVTLEPIWLDNAQYPVTIDPTFGFASQGASSVDLDGRIRGTAYTAPEAGTVTSMTAYVTSWDATNDALGFGFYLRSTAALVDKVFPLNTTGGTDGWNTLNLSSQSITTVDYVLCARGGAGDTINFFYDAVTLHRYFKSSIPTATTWADPFDGTAGNAAFKYSIYATYTASAAASNTITPTTLLQSGQLLIQSGQMIVQ